MLNIKRKLSQKGFSLIELMVAVAILALAIFGIFHAYSAGFMGMADARDRTVASNYMREAMEDIKNMDFDQITPDWPEFKDQPIPGTKFGRVVIVQESTNLKKITTKVYWKDRNDNPKMVETDMLVHFIETTAGIPTRLMLIANPYNVLTEDDILTDDISENRSIITAVVKDAKGNTVTTYNNNITFTLDDINSSYLINNSGIPVGKVYSVNAEQGIATVTFQASEIEGDVTIEASDSGLTSDSVTIKVTDPGKPVKINLTASPIFMIPESISIITATVVNAGGATVESATNEITFSVSDPDLGTLSNQSFLISGVATIDLNSSATPGTITVTASSSGLEPGVINVYTGGWIYLSASSNNVPVNETSVITVTTKDLNGIPINYNRIINLSVDGYIDPESPEIPAGFGDLPSSVTFDGTTSSKTIMFIGTNVGKVKITADDSTPVILTPENELILNVIPELNPDHIKVDAVPSSISIDEEGASSTITAWVEDDKYVPIASYDIPITFSTDNGSLSLDGINPEPGSYVIINPDENGVAKIYLLPPNDTGTANISATSDYYEKTISGNTRVGFYSEADHIDLIAIPQSILTGGGSGGTCTIIATIKDGATVVSGYDGDVTFTIVEGYPNGVKFTSTNQSSITISAVGGVATIALQSKNWVGTAKIRVTASEGIPDLLEQDINIPVIANKNLEIFMLYNNESTNFLKYYYPEDGLLKDSWGTADITYGKFCVDSYNNLYILDINGNCIQKKSSRGDFILKSDEIPKNSYTIDDSSYAINVGPNGYIYFTQYTVDVDKYCINKINPNTLIIEDILNLPEGKIYYGIAVDSDGSIYIHNYTDQAIEKWNFIEGFTELSLNLSSNYEFSELAIAGDYIGGVGEAESVKKAFIIHKDLSTNEVEFILSDIPEPLYISSIDSDFLFSGLNIKDEVVFGRYGTDGSLKWDPPKIIPVDDIGYSDCIIGAYPF